MTEPSSATTSENTAPKEWHMSAAWYGLAVLVITTIFSLINLQLIYVLTEAFKLDLSLTDTQIGALTGIALGLVTALATYPMGWLSDKINRKLLLSVCVFIWSSSAAAAGFSATYEQLFLAVVGIALGEAVLGPITYSIIPDLFPKDKRVTANYIFFASSILGGSAGLALGGSLIGFIETYREGWAFLPPDMDTWRLTLIASGVPGILVIFLISLMKLKRRVNIQPADSTPPQILPFIKDNARSLFGVFIGFGLSYSAKTTIFMWSPPAFMRVFGEDTATTGVNLGLITAASAVVGVLASGFAYRMLHEKLKEITASRVAFFSLAITAMSGVALTFANTVTQAYTIIFFFSAGATATMSLSPTLLQLVSPAEIRGRIIAIGGLFSVMFSAVTPLLVGIVSDILPDWDNTLIVAMITVCAPCLVLSALIIKYGESTLAATIHKATGYEK